MSCVVFAHLERQRTRSPFSTEGAALAHISNYEVRGGGVESSLPLHRCRPRPPFTLTVIDELRASPRQSRRPTTVSCLSGTKTVLSAEAAASSTFSGVNLTGREMGLNPPGEGEPSAGGMRLRTGVIRDSWSVLRVSSDSDLSCSSSLPAHSVSLDTELEPQHE